MISLIKRRSGAISNSNKVRGANNHSISLYFVNGGAEGAKSTTEARRYVKVEARDRTERAEERTD